MRRGQRGSDGGPAGRGTGPVGKGKSISRHGGKEDWHGIQPSSISSTGSFPPEPGLLFKLKLLFKQVSKLLFLQHAHSGLRKEVPHPQVVTFYDPNELFPDTCNVSSEAS